ncbi:hypothetical protein BGW36DRAFT_388813 [Talaromyces proteolyticus]|uniref:Zn(2)-C6 fungal-type domain-containing protein n=1 Tax=Talaromyces proteolyticus TaxID=1131652 RepID=A0AAD4KKQ0_9EURO|nr:uncharacterized protein BGW36DRAFT_388813 [Talaromyces proteolyticus]KAH8690466.1 hypothetical protein BGW36DRAFT_388813 [Talaromyces proteolyticus]
MSFSIYRKRLACVECTRRKVRCDKILPCRNCTVKGIGCSRPRNHINISNQGPADEESPGSNIRLPDSNDAAENSNRALLELVEKLNAKIDHLEFALQKKQSMAVSQEMSNEPELLSPSPISLISPIPSEIPREVVNKEAKETTAQSGSEVEDAATILEFLAWGRRKDPNLTVFPRDIETEDNIPFFSSQITLRSYLQSLLPSRPQVYTLVQYHCDCLLWYHGSFHATVLWKSLEDFYNEKKGQIELTDTQLQWTSLLFAIILGSITCAPRQIILSWGFNDEERNKLSHRWFQAMNVCLQYSDYMSSHSIFSVQAIATATHTAHMLGHSNSQAVLLASAVRIAQNLGLHRLGKETDEHMSPDLIDREIGRRVWCQLCTQDWFSIPFTESYLIHRSCYDTEKPRNCNEIDMTVQSDDIPTTMSYSRFFFEVATLMPQVHDALASSNTMYTRYEKVLEYDQRLRLLATVRLPYYLQNVPIDPAWPCYVPWARRCLAISTSHKVIMIHRKFLGMSFANPMFSRTRRTCVAAARTIIKELRGSSSDGGPVLWIHHAFIVAAGIILCLDIIHSPEFSPECDEHRRLVQDGLRLLSTCETNMIATRGIPLIQAMLANEGRIREKTFNQVEASVTGNTPNKIDARNLDIKEIIRSFYMQDRLNSFTATVSRYPSAEWFATDSQSSWPPNTSEKAALPPLLNQPAYESDFPDNFDDVLALAANYIT